MKRSTGYDGRAPLLTACLLVYLPKRLIGNWPPFQVFLGLGNVLKLVVPAQVRLDLSDTSTSNMQDYTEVLRLKPHSIPPPATPELGPAIQLSSKGLDDEPDAQSGRIADCYRVSPSRSP
jgi:hypothetical protein